MANRKKYFLIFGGVIAVLIVGLVSIRLFSTEKLKPGRVEPEQGPRSFHGATAEVVVRTVIEWYDAVGSVKPKTQARIEAQVAAQITDVRVQAGESIEKGRILVRLEDERMRTKLSQARQTLQSAVARRGEARQSVNVAEAAFAEAEAAYSRIRKFFEADAATEQELEQAQSRFLQAKAGLRRAEEGLSGASAGIRLAEEMVQEAGIALDYTVIKAPAAGEVLQRLVDPGDMAMPGKPLLLLRTTGALQLEANVREGLINQIRPGDTRQVRLTTLDRTVEAVIDEIIPFVDPRTRTFRVKADLPEIEGVYPGMYGKLLIPYREVPVILIPLQAVRRVGQLQFVVVQTPAGRQRRYIKTGQVYDDGIEVLSGLNSGETLLLEESNVHGD